MAVGARGVFVNSLVWSENRTSLTYPVDIFIDDNAVVQQAQCDCGSGQGPTAHCKHVGTVLYAAIQFANTGEVLCEVTCTQVGKTRHLYLDNSNFDLLQL